MIEMAAMVVLGYICDIIDINLDKYQSFISESNDIS